MSTFNEINNELDALKLRAAVVKGEHNQLIIDTNANASAISALESIDTLDIKSVYTTMTEFNGAGLQEADYELYHDAFAIDGAIYVLVPTGTIGEVAVSGWTVKSLKKLSDAVQLSALDNKIDLVKDELNTSISSAETKHNTELASEVAARQAALTALESKHDTEKAILDAAIAAESSARETAIAAESSARSTKDVEIEAAHAADKAANIVTLGKFVEVLNERLSN